MPSVIGAGRCPMSAGVIPNNRWYHGSQSVLFRIGGAGGFLMIKSKSEGENICVKNCRRYTIPVRWSRISIRCGWTTVASRRTPTRRRSPFPSSCLPQRHRPAAHGPRHGLHAAGYPHPLQADAGLFRPVASRHRPRRYRHPDQGGGATAGGGHPPPRDVGGKVLVGGVWREGEVRQPYRGAAEEDGCLL